MKTIVIVTDIGADLGVKIKSLKEKHTQINAALY